MTIYDKSHAQMLNVKKHDVVKYIKKIELRH